MKFQFFFYTFLSVLANFQPVNASVMQTGLSIVEVVVCLVDPGTFCTIIQTINRSIFDNDGENESAGGNGSSDSEVEEEVKEEEGSNGDASGGEESGGVPDASEERVEVIIPSNDQCLNAKQIFLQTRISGETTNASVDEIAQCGNAMSDTGSGGVWYYTVGNGAEFGASTCATASFDTQIFVFSGSGCDQLECVTSNDDSCGTQSTVTWKTNFQEKYYIYVTGFKETGAFQLDLFEPVQNDLCKTAAIVDLGTFTQGSTTSATTSFVEKCGNASVGSTPGVWYRITGNGGKLFASTCDYTNFDTQISVFRTSTEDCGNLICVAGEDDSCESGQVGDVRTRVNFETISGEDYRIFVHGFNAGDGDFLLDVGNVEN